MIVPQAEFGSGVIALISMAVCVNAIFWVAYRAWPVIVLENDDTRASTEAQFGALAEKKGYPLEKSLASEMVGLVIALYTNNRAELDRKIIRGAWFVANLTFLFYAMESIANTAQLRDRKFYETLFASSLENPGDYQKLGRELEAVNRCYRDTIFFLLGNGDWYHPEKSVAECYDAAPTTQENLNRLRRFKARHVENFQESLKPPGLPPPRKE